LDKSIQHCLFSAFKIKAHKEEIRSLKALSILIFCSGMQLPIQEKQEGNRKNIALKISCQNTRKAPILNTLMKS